MPIKRQAKFTEHHRPKRLKSHDSKGSHTHPIQEGEPDEPKTNEDWDDFPRRQRGHRDTDAPTARDISSAGTNQFATLTDAVIRRRKSAEKRKQKVRLQAAEDKVHEAEKRISAHITRKRLVPGSRILVAVLEIAESELIVSMPNFLTGYIPASRTHRRDSDIETTEDLQGVNLQQRFCPGQLLLTSVVSVRQLRDIRASREFKSFEIRAHSYASSRQFELSIEPSVVFERVACGALGINSPVLAVVDSIEDEGYALRLGDGKVGAFVPFEPAMADLQSMTEASQSPSEPLRTRTVGSYIMARVVAHHESKRTCSVSLQTFTQDFTDGNIIIDAVMPGTLVNARVVEVRPDSVHVRFLGCFDGSIDHLHLAPALKSGYHLGQQLAARVIASFSAHSTRSFALSNLPHLVSAELDPHSMPQRGHIISEALLLHVEPMWGLILSFDFTGGRQNRGFVHVSEASDNRLDRLEIGTWRLGSKHQARVVGYSLFGDISALSLRPSTLSQLFLTPADLSVGQVVQGVVHQYTTAALFISLHGAVDAVVWPLHLSDTSLRHPERKFRPGAKVTGRIFSLDTKRSRVAVTLRRALLESVLPLPVTDDSRCTGAPTAGVVVKLEDQGVIIEIFGGYRSFVPITELADEYTRSPREILSIGQIVTARLLGYSQALRRFKITLRSADDRTGTRVDTSRVQRFTVNQENMAIEHLRVGQILNVRLVLKDLHGWLVQMSPNLRGRVHWTDVADDFDLANELAPADVRPAAIVDIDSSKGRIDLSLRSSLISSVHAHVKDPVVNSLQELQIGMRLRGIVCNIISFGVFVAIGRSVTARVMIRELFDSFVEEWQAHFARGQAVTGEIISIDESKKQVEMRLRTANTIKHDTSGHAWSKLCVGSRVTCRVKALRPYGCLLAIQNSPISGLCHQSQMGDMELRNLRIGYHLDATILELDHTRHRVFFTMVPSETDVANLNDDHVGREINVATDSGSEDLVMHSGAPSSKEQPHGSATVAKLDIPAQLQWGDVYNLPFALEALDSHQSSPRRRNIALVSQMTSSSIVDYEDQLLRQPDSSALWKDYITFFRNASRFSEARAVAKRALDTINYREGQERLTIWISWLQLEIMHGSQASFDAVFSQAVQYNDSLTIFYRAARLYNAVGNSAKSLAMLEEATRRFSEKLDTWLRLAEAHMLYGSAQAAHETLKKSLRSLQTNQHIEMISKFAQLEFKVGDPERGRVLFEGVMARVPRRLDLCNIYIDMEIRCGNQAGARALFGRILQHRQSSKQSRSWLKKWLAFENFYGTAETAEYVRGQAMAVAHDLG